MAERIVKTELRCPRCGCRDLILTETGTWTTQWFAVDGKFDRELGFHNPESVDRLDAECQRCRHAWKPRKAQQIDDVVVGFVP